MGTKNIQGNLNITGSVKINGTDVCLIQYGTEDPPAELPTGTIYIVYEEE